MPDPFEVLRLASAPVDPDPQFAAALRGRIERALTLPRGVTVSDTTIDRTTADPARAGTDDTGRRGEPAARVGAAIPYLAVRDGRAAIAWYTDVFGARLVGEPVVMPDDRVGHAELEIAGGVLFLAEEFPEIGHRAPEPGATSVSLVLEVPDVDATVAAALAAGATQTREVGEAHGSRNATLVDPFGHRWMVQTTLPVDRYRQGDIGYVSLWVPEVDRAAAFFGSVLGWAYAPGDGPGRRVEGTVPHHGLWGGRPHTLMCCYVVDDVDEAVARVRAAGGTAEEPTDEPYGRVASCVDDQDLPFALYTPPVDGWSPRGPLNGAAAGDVSYVTMEVVDSARTRAFYGEVLGWTFNGGRVDDGWEVDGNVPMTGLHGGHERCTVVPMYKVDDIDGAVARVRAAGGTATDPERQPYGVTAVCADDQGTRFYLGDT